MTEQFRTEKDSMGEFQVPIDAKYGASTARAVDNFPISNLRFSRSFIKALGEIKKACAKVNQNNKLLDKNFADSIIDAAQQVIDCLLYTSPSPRDKRQSRMPSSA